MIFLFLILLFSPDKAMAAPEYLSLGKAYYLDDHTNGFAISNALQESNLRDLSQMGDVNASYRFGLIMQMKGEFKEAVRLFDKACAGNVARACNNAGFIKHHNLEKLKNPDIEAALPYYDKAKKLKNSYALYNLARYYFRQKNFLQSYLHYELAYLRFKNRADQQIILNNKSGVQKKLNVLEKSYIEKYYPADLAPLANGRTIGKRKINKDFPLPPVDGLIKDNAGLITFNNLENSDKKPVMLDWRPTRSDFIPLPVPLVTEDISAPESISSLTYRYDLPATIKLTLAETITSLPMLLGDEAIIYVYSGEQEFANAVWRVDSAIPMTALGTGWAPLVEDGWEIFSLRPQAKGMIQVKFINDKTNEELRAVLHVQ